MTRSTCNIAILFATTLIATWIIRLTDVDLAVAERFYCPEKGWHLGQSPLYQFAYKYAAIPALLITFVSLAILAFGIGRPKLIRYRKLCIYFLSVTILGAGIITNLVLKNEWGRPRPRDCAQFGGANTFEPVLTMDLASSGKSFPCGHATMGFFFFSFAVLLWSRYRFWSIASALLAILFGSAIGFTRIVQGAHFFSDVIWAGSVMLLSSLILHRLLKLENHWLLYTTPVTKAPRWLQLASPVAFCSIASLSLLCWPSAVVIERNLTQLGYAPESISLNYPTDLLLEPGSELSFQLKGNGFGSPKCKIPVELDTQGQRYTISEGNKRGYFTEYTAATRFSIPEQTTTMHFEIGSEVQHIIIDSRLLETNQALTLTCNPGQIVKIRRGNVIENAGFSPEPQPEHRRTYHLGQLTPQASAQ